MALYSEQLSINKKAEFLRPDALEKKCRRNEDTAPITNIEDNESSRCLYSANVDFKDTSQQSEQTIEDEFLSNLKQILS